MQAELDAAQASGGLVTVPVPLADGSTLNVPLGEEYVVHPTTGVYYQVRRLGLGLQGLHCRAHIMH
jgi:hypothetical protein